MTATREIGPFMQKFRALLLGRNHMNNLRFDHLQAPRSIPEPNMPPGPSHNLAANYYYTRDGRREVAPPAVLADGNKALASGEETAAAVMPKIGKTPGRVHNITDLKGGDI